MLTTQSPFIGWKKEGMGGPNQTEFTFYRDQSVLDTFINGTIDLKKVGFKFVNTSVSYLCPVLENEEEAFFGL